MIATIKEQQQDTLSYIRDEYLLDFSEVDPDTRFDFITAVSIYEHEGYSTTNAIRFSLRDLDITKYREV